MLRLHVGWPDIKEEIHFVETSDIVDTGCRTVVAKWKDLKAIRDVQDLMLLWKSYSDSVNIIFNNKKDCQKVAKLVDAEYQIHYEEDSDYDLFWLLEQIVFGADRDRIWAYVTELPVPFVLVMKWLTSSMNLLERENLLLVIDADKIKYSADKKYLWALLCFGWFPQWKSKGGGRFAWNFRR